MIDAHVVASTEELEPLQSQWDALAVSLGRPYCTPAWLLAWWCHLAPRAARLRVVVALDGPALVGIAGFYSRRSPAGYSEYRLLGTGPVGGRLEPLAAVGREEEVARAIAPALAGARPRPSVVRLEPTDASSPWPALLAGAWPASRGADLRRQPARPAPVVELDGSFEDWLAAKSSNFRQEARRKRRHLEREGAAFRTTAEPAQLERDVGILFDLHARRWSGERRSALRAATQAMVLEVGRRLASWDRFRLWILEIGDAPVSAQLLISAGAEVSYWNGGWDPGRSNLSPAMQTLLAATQDAFARGERRLDLGVGENAYKLRLANGDAPIAGAELIPRDRRYPVTRAQRGLKGALAAGAGAASRAVRARRSSATS